METENKNYQEFLESKIKIHTATTEAIPPVLDGRLFPHQVDTVKWMLKQQRALLAASFGLGKCHGAGTLILMADGSIKAVEDVKQGDRLMGDDGTPRNVLSLARGREEMFRVTLKNGDSYVCNKSHIFSLKLSNKYKAHESGQVVDMPLTGWSNLPKYAKNNCYKHYKSPVDFKHQDVPFDAYLYGAWLGDGHQGSLTWTINDKDVEIVERIKEFAASVNCKVRETPGAGCVSYHISKGMTGKSRHCDEFYFVKASSGEDGKRINRKYLINDRNIRLQLLAGLIDTDGYLIDKCFEIATKWKGLRDDILFLARSLGLAVTHRLKIINNVTYYRIWISGDTDLVPCLTRKKAGKREQIKNPLMYGFTIEAIGEGDYFGFEIDGNHRYLLGDFTVTHNTLMQISVAKSLVAFTGKPFLVVCPLGVKHQFQEEDGKMLGVDFQYVRNDAEVKAATSLFLITNYERLRDGNIDPRVHEFCGVSLDEGSIIRSLGSKTVDVFQRIFANVPYRFICTATPSPNNYRELIYYADFLGVMDRGQALTRWFKRNPDKAGDLRLTPQHEESFWMWVASWALFLNKPSDLGYSDEGYDLPELKVIYHEIPTDHSKAGEQLEKDGQRKLLVDVAAGVSAAVKEKRATLTARIAKAKEIIAESPNDNWIIWHHLEDERRAIEKTIEGSVAVYGSLELEKREQRILDFAHGKIKLLASKPELTGSGCNFQRHCHKNVFVGIDFSFQDFIQSVHRTYRFLQDQVVEVHIIHSEAESGIIEILNAKWDQHNQLQKRMADIMQQFGLSHAAISGDLKRHIGIERYEVKGETYTAVHNDCVAELKQMADNSVGLIHTSIPFGNHYEYTTNYEDFGHNPNDEDFFSQMDFLIPELLRVLKPGRVAVVHVKDRILYGHQTASGFMEVDEFSDHTVQAFKKHGFLREGRRTIVTDVVRENNSTYRLGWSEMCKDASKMGAGLPEYLLLFRKPPTSNDNSRADEPVVKNKEEYSRGRWQIEAHNLWRSNGVAPTIEDLTELTPQQISAMHAAEQITEPYDYNRHVEISESVDSAGRLPSSFMLLPPKVTKSESDLVWDDVNFMRSLNSAQARKGAANHICPLPFDIVERVLRLYSNEGDLVLDPFGGLGTVAYCSIKLKRTAYTCELNADYFKAMVRYCQEAETELLTPTLFD